MRSLWYILTGRPITLNDFMDAGQKGSLSDIKIDLEIQEVLREPHVISRYLAIFSATYQGKRIHCRTLLTACFVDAAGQGRHTSVIEADRRLEKVLQDFQRADMHVRGRHARFATTYPNQIRMARFWI